jgi:hypothetical protein
LVKNVFNLTVFLLLALWLPATNHCELTAADLVGQAEGGHCSMPCDTNCEPDLCSIIEGDAYSMAAIELRILPPSVSLETCLLLLFATPEVDVRPPVPFVCAPPELESLHRTWSFVRRAAPLARAPSLLG